MDCTLSISVYVMIGHLSKRSGWMGRRTREACLPSSVMIGVASVMSNGSYLRLPVL